jgi:hypothetical protein
VTVAGSNVYVIAGGRLYSFTFGADAPSQVIPIAIWAAAGLLVVLALARRLRARRIA